MQTSLDLLEPFSYNNQKRPWLPNKWFLFSFFSEDIKKKFALMKYSKTNPIKNESFLFQQDYLVLS